jgi:hypothetical protein
MYSRQHRTGKSSVNNSDSTAINQFSPRSFVQQPQTATAPPQTDQASDLEAISESVESSDSGMIDSGVFSRNTNRPQPQLPRVQMKLNLPQQGNKFGEETEVLHSKGGYNTQSGYIKPIEIQTQSSNNLIQCKIVTIGAEKVDVANDDEEKEAQRIIKDIKDKFGIDISSLSGVEAIKKQYDKVPDSVKNGLQTKEWKFKELKALEKALQHFAPILGDKRKDSSRAGVDQEITSASKVDQAIDRNNAAGVLDNTTLGEFFAGSKNFSMFSKGTNSTVDFKDNDKQLEGTAIHEIAHGIMKYALNDYVKALDYWTDAKTKSGKADAEAPITKYGQTNASEDFSEAVMYYFVENETLKTKCPKRYEFIKKTVDDWTKKDKNP